MRMDPHLARRASNHRPLTPLDFLDRAVAGFPERRAVVWRDRELSYAGFGRLVAAMAAFLRDHGVAAGDVVSLICGNRPEMLAAHYAVPLLGAVLNSINTRLDPATVSYILGHAESRLVIADPASYGIAAEAGREQGVPVFRLTDSMLDGQGAQASRMLAGLRAEGDVVAGLMPMVVRELLRTAALARVQAAGGNLGAEMKSQAFLP